MTIKEFIHELKQYSGDSLVRLTDATEILKRLRQSTGKPPKPDELCPGCGMIPRGWITQKEPLWALGNRPYLEKIFEKPDSGMLFIFSDLKKAEEVAKMFKFSPVVVFPVLVGKKAGE